MSNMLQKCMEEFNSLRTIIPHNLPTWELLRSREQILQEYKDTISNEQGHRELALGFSRAASLLEETKGMTGFQRQLAWVLGWLTHEQDRSYEPLVIKLGVNEYRFLKSPNNITLTVSCYLDLEEFKTVLPLTMKLEELQAIIAKECPAKKLKDIYVLRQKCVDGRDMETMVCELEEGTYFHSVTTTDPDNRGVWRGIHRDIPKLEYDTRRRHISELV